MNMSALVWLLPLLFILHDMEEVVFVQSWKRKETSLRKRKEIKFIPFGTIKTSAECAVSVYEELLILSVVSVVSLLTTSYGIWYGMLFVNIIHLILPHIIGTIVLYGTYVPGVVTAFITLGPCIYVFLLADGLLRYNMIQRVIYILLAAVIIIVNLKLLHKNGYKFGRYFN